MAEQGDPARVTRRGAPRWVIWALIVVSTLVAVGAVLNTWIDRQVLETDEWVEVTDEFLDDDRIRGALATFLVDELFRTVDVRSSLEDLLPDVAAGLAGPIAAQLEANAVPVADRFLASPAAQTTWTRVNEAAHGAFVRVVRDDLRGGLTTADGDFVVDLGVLVTAVAERLGLPDAVVERVGDGTGTLVVFESDQLDLIQNSVAVIDVLSVFLLLVVVAGYAAAVWLSSDRRRTLRDVGWAIVIASAVLLVVRRLSVRVATEQLAQADSGRDAVRAMTTIATNLLNELAWAGVAIGLLIVAYAVLVGPTAAAARVRRFGRPVLTSTAGIWAAALVGVILLAVFVPGFTLRTWVAGAVFVALAVAAVESTRRVCVAERDAERAADRTRSDGDDEASGDDASGVAPDDVSGDAASDDAQPSPDTDGTASEYTSMG